MFLSYHLVRKYCAINETKLHEKDVMDAILVIKIVFGVSHNVTFRCVGFYLNGTIKSPNEFLNYIDDQFIKYIISITAELRYVEVVGTQKNTSTKEWFEINKWELKGAKHFGKIIV